MTYFIQLQIIMQKNNFIMKKYNYNLPQRWF